jgi:hypothetical protein
MVERVALAPSAALDHHDHGSAAIEGSKPALGPPLVHRA